MKINMNYSMKTIQAKGASDAYEKMVNLIDKEGHMISSRNELTKEVLNVYVEIENPRDRIVNISNFNLPFILQETFDILNSNPPRVIHSREMLQKTMSSDKDLYFFGNELRQALSRWSLHKIKDRFIQDKNTRKASLDFGNRRNNKHTPCMLYAHFIIRDNKFYMTAETRGTAVSMGFINDVFVLTLIQEIIYGWLLETYPELELGSFSYKTISLHEYQDSIKPINETDNISYFPLWDQKLIPYEKIEQFPISLTYKEYVQDMGALYYYSDDFINARIKEDIDEGDITLVSDILKPQKEMFNSEVFYNWANTLYYYTKSIEFGKQDYLDIFIRGDLYK